MADYDKEIAAARTAARLFGKAVKNRDCNAAVKKLRAFHKAVLSAREQRRGFSRQHNAAAERMFEAFYRMDRRLARCQIDAYTRDGRGSSADVQRARDNFPELWSRR